jgi:uncharacterized membrane protein
MVKLTLAFLVGFVYVWALWFYQSDLHSSVALVSAPLWVALALRAVSFWGLLVFLAIYMPVLREWLLAWVRQVVESEDRNV